MGRTIPTFRIAAVLEENEWRSFKKYLNKNDRKLFKEMFSIVRLYNSACSYSVIPIRIYPIIMSIVFHHYKTSLNNSFKFVEEDNNNNNSIILKRELDRWNNFSSILRKLNRDLFNQMLQSSYKYSNAIDAKGENYATESLLMSLMFEQYKIIK
ncbi:MAG TPA: hypothetical protein VFP49_12875 [Nitrososphaeraceae archaeon]|nr:hypothetical protein [Nitrososphaeraceae archaeon]